MSNKLWQTKATVGLHPAVEAYTVGDDYQLDQQLLGYDIAASKAHASMLQSVGLLTATQGSQLVEALDALQQLWLEGGFEVKKEQEDGHTAIETYLVEKLGNTGKKIHAARSRNDQALVMMRLYLKDSLQNASTSATELATALKAAALKAGPTPMPGYTHMQKAMPTTVACWLNSYADGFIDAAQLIDGTLHVVDQNPLGSAAGFGISLPIDRNHTTKALGFKKTQDNPMYCGLSRGFFELIAVQTLNPLMVLAGNFAQDMMLFTTQEFDFFSLPDSFTSGSSIMPHKHNYDLFEIMRGQAHAFGGYAQQLQAIVTGAGSGYHRDLQLTKAITLKAFTSVLDTLQVLNLAAINLKLNKDKLAESITTEMHSVTEINKLISQGVPMRDAYIKVKDSLRESNKAA